MQRSLKKNMVMNIILTLSNIIFPLITYSYVARILTPSGTGKVAFVYSVLQYFSYFAMFGIPFYGLRECAKVRKDKDKMSKLVQELLIINFLFTVIAYICLLGLVILLPAFYEYRDLFAIMCGYVLLSACGMEWLYQAVEEYTYITIRSLVFKVISVILTFMFIHTKEDYLIYGFLTVFALSANNICNMIGIRKIIFFKRYHDYEIKKHFKPILALFTASVAITIYANIDVTMLGVFSSEVEVGLYNGALKIRNVISAVATAVTMVFIPRITFCFGQKDFSSIKKLIMVSLRVSLLLAIPGAIFIFFNAKDVIMILCGVEFMEAYKSLRVLMLCIIPLILTNIFGNLLLIPSGNEKRYTQSVVIGLIVNLILNSLMIPLWGARGAAYATLVTESWNVLWMSMGCIEYRNYILHNLKIWKYMLGYIIGGILAFFTSTYYGDRVVIRFVCSAAIYFCSIYVVLLICKEETIMMELVRLKNMIKREQCQ